MRLCACVETLPTTPPPLAAAAAFTHTHTQTRDVAPLPGDWGLTVVTQEALDGQRGIQEIKLEKTRSRTENEENKNHRRERVREFRA